MKSTRLIYFIIALGVLLRLVWIFAVPSTPVSDSAWYYARGIEIATGMGYADNGIPTAYWPVGYPAFLGLLFWLVGPSLLNAKLVNVMLSAGILTLIDDLGDRLFSQPIGKIATLIIAIYPNYIAYSSLLLSETLLLFLVLLAISLLLRNHTLLSGVVWGLAVLVKPQVIFLPLLILVILRPNRFYLQMVTVYLTLVLTLVPWTYRNYQVFGSIVFVSTNSGINLLIGNNPRATGDYMVPNLALPAGLTEIERDEAAKTAAIDFAINDPTAVLRLVPLKIYAQYFGDYEGVIWNQLGLKAPSIILSVFGLIAQLFYLFLTIAVLIGLTRKGVKNTSANLLIGGIFLYFTLIAVVFFGSTRFHFLVIPWLAMAAGNAIISITDRRIRPG